MNYQIRYSDEARRILPRLPGRYRQRAKRAIESLADNSRPAGAEELRGLSGVFRVWLNGWRIIYQVNEEDATLLIVGIRYKTGPETYENLGLG
ncbi:MAG: type II toxin-antitoxin system RelE/ParE family toxin [Caldilineaceae bacterium]|nr:type II toxin-antitoxin system RelE/ParE family toxin [Caldilineaceae bacterium]